MQGTVREFDADRAWGFIVALAPGHPDFFVHRNQIIGHGLLQAGDTVEFMPKIGPKGSYATNVRRVAAAVNP